MQNNSLKRQKKYRKPWFKVWESLVGANCMSQPPPPPREWMTNTLKILLSLLKRYIVVVRGLYGSFLMMHYFPIIYLLICNQVVVSSRYFNKKTKHITNLYIYGPLFVRPIQTKIAECWNAYCKNLYTNRFKNVFNSVRKYLSRKVDFYVRMHWTMESVNILSRYL